MAEFDTILKGGTIVDGTRVPRYKGDTRTLSLEEAHFRLSALPAWAAQFKDRGTLREGPDGLKEGVCHDGDGSRGDSYWDSCVFLPPQQRRPKPND